MPQEHWSKRLHDVLSANEKPSNQLLEEAVESLLEERQGLKTVLTDLAKQVGNIILARKAGSTEDVLILVDALIEKHVVVVDRAPAVVQ